MRVADLRSGCFAGAFFRLGSYTIWTNSDAVGAVENRVRWAWAGADAADDFAHAAKRWCGPRAQNRGRFKRIGP